jgi:hypothetical protein
MNRCETDPSNYKKVPKAPAPKKVKQYIPPALRTWPLTWSEYKHLPHEIKEEIYSAWCQLKDLDPDSESTANTFFDEMDLVQDTQDDEQQVV